MTTHYIWDVVNDSYLMETDGDGNVTAEYTTEPVPYGRVISQRRGNATSFYHYDGQGSTRQLTDENGNVTDEYTYSAFGETVASSGTTVNPFRYNGLLGYYRDAETDKYYVRARMYCLTLAHWMSRDPLRGADRLNQYRYVANSPIGMSDPSGLLMSYLVEDVLKEDNGVFSPTSLSCASQCWVFLDNFRTDEGRFPAAAAGICVCRKVGDGCANAIECENCICLFPYNNGYTYEPKACPAIDACVLKHENEHLKKAPCIKPCLKDGVPDTTKPCIVGPEQSGRPKERLLQDECLLKRRQDRPCLTAVKDGDIDARCRQRAEDMLTDLENWITKNCAGR